MTVSDADRANRLDGEYQLGAEVQVVHLNGVELGCGYEALLVNPPRHVAAVTGQLSGAHPGHIEDGTEPLQDPRKLRASSQTGALRNRRRGRPRGAILSTTKREFEALIAGWAKDMSLRHEEVGGGSPWREEAGRHGRGN